MFRELKSLEYAIEIVKVMSPMQGVLGSKDIHQLMVDSGMKDASLSYVQKLLSKMAKVGILVSGDMGYELAAPMDETPVSSILDICDMPRKDSIIYPLCTQIKQAFTLTTIDELLEIS